MILLVIGCVFAPDLRAGRADVCGRRLRGRSCCCGARAICGMRTTACSPARTSISPQTHGALLTSSLAGQRRFSSRWCFFSRSAVSRRSRRWYSWEFRPPRSLRAAASRTPRSAHGGLSHPPPSISFLPHETSSTSYSMSFRRTCSTISSSRTAPHSIGSSPDSSILPTTPARSRRRRSACRRCLQGRSTGTRNRRRSSFEKRSSTRPCSRKCRTLDTTSTRCRSYRPIHSSSGWVRKQHRTGRARVSGSGNRSSAAKIIARSPRVSCLNCRSSAMCRTRRRLSASTVQIHSIGR